LPAHELPADPVVIGVEDVQGDRVGAQQLSVGS
jgi:hypothetical protein